jgi:hypothetical protein
MDAWVDGWMDGWMDGWERRVTNMAMRRFISIKAIDLTDSFIHAHVSPFPHQNHTSIQTHATQSQSVDAFVQLMAELNLPYPKKIDQALPANLVCGIVD